MIKIYTSSSSKENTKWPKHVWHIYQAIMDKPIKDPFWYVFKQAGKGMLMLEQ